MKWEDNIKTTLEKRRIEPAESSWNDLAKRLDATDKKKPKVLYLWTGVAASIVAILFTVTLFFNRNTTEVQGPILVDTQEQVEDRQMSMEKVPEENHVVETHQKDEVHEPIEKNKPKNELSPNIKQTVAVVEIEKEIQTEPLKSSLQKETLEEEKVTEIVAQIQDLKSKGQTVTDADIDAMLVQAQKEIRYQTILKEGALTVDANALLQDVESDLQQSFRNKIFEALKNSYETVKTAVAERNN